MFGIFNLMGSIGHYYLSPPEIPKTRGKGHFKQAHKNNYKQKIKGKKGKR